MANFRPYSTEVTGRALLVKINTARTTVLGKADHLTAEGRNAEWDRLAAPLAAEVTAYRAEVDAAGEAIANIPTHYRARLLPPPPVVPDVATNAVIDRVLARPGDGLKYARTVLAEYIGTDIATSVLAEAEHHGRVDADTVTAALSYESAEYARALDVHRALAAWHRGIAVNLAERAERAIKSMSAARDHTNAEYVLTTSQALANVFGDESRITVGPKGIVMVGGNISGNLVPAEVN